MTRTKPRDRVFLDANVLFSAAYRADSGLRRLWKYRSVALITSGYAAEEASRNLEDVDQQRRLGELLKKVEIVPESLGRHEPEGWNLLEKDRPILAAAIRAEATHLLTGDTRHFGHLMGSTVEGVQVLRPAQYLRR
ncbi:MAG: PIN domain-containing protein [Acidimicrobiia bacterium]|nr:PIN domain-containing protein [Acidimicrobiia bacterium]